MNKQNGSVGIISLIVILILIGVGGYYFNRKKVEIPSNIIPTPTETGISTQLNIVKALPQNLKVVSSEANKFIAEGDYKGIPYRVGVNITLRPDGKCLDETYFYSTKTKKGGYWASISPDEHKSGDYKLYLCSRGTVIDGFTIPIISGEVQDLYANTDGFVASQTMQVAVATIKNNFYNQIYVLQNPKYSLQELDKYGNALEEIFYSRCLMPMYNKQPLLKVGPNAGGCSPTYWQDSEQHTFNALDFNMLDYGMRKNFLAFISNPGCKKDYVGNYLLNLASNPQQFKEDTFIKDLSCAGKITLEKGKSMPY